MLFIDDGITDGVQMPLQLRTSCLSPDLNIGVMKLSFQKAGKSPVLRDELNKYVRRLAIESIHLFNKTEGTPSGPQLLDSLSPLIPANTSDADTLRKGQQSREYQNQLVLMNFSNNILV
ncbi:hypothetical protein HHI36_011018 [Cryptolaemus montrouzieri]|uniref:Uncharacterized protein n=1 Tax=Cryptolaemus montrouzieri TaxID=559131 RepID=A0ABD2MKI1_9CUCU